MNAKINYGLQGAFKVDYYKSGSNKLQETTDWFSNFITPTGLMMPLRYAFADCFRYLSIGSVGSANYGTVSLVNSGTTGLTAPIANYKTNFGTLQGGQYIDWRGYASGADGTSNCGSLLLPEGPRFFRGWNIPTGGENYFVQEDAGFLTVQEFMVSPSSGEDEFGKSAFSRITKNITIPNGYRVVISYQLKINIQNTGDTLFRAGTFSTGNAEVSEDSEIVAGWANLSGYFKQVYHGLRCIDTYGLTYVPKFGDIMEPASQNLSSSRWYLSPDNSQFDINGSGGAQSSISSSYLADGLMPSVRQLDLVLASDNTVPDMSFDQKVAAFNNNNPTIKGSLPTDTIPISIRIGRTSNPLKLPQLSGYKGYEESETFSYQAKQDVSAKGISYATPGVKGFNPTLADFGKKAVFSSAAVQLPFNGVSQNSISGRRKTITRRAVFSPVNSLGYNTRFGSLVYAFSVASTSDGTTTYYPTIDTLFFDSSGRSLMPHYRFITGIGFAERGSGVIDFNVMLSGNNQGSVYKFSPYKTGFFGPYANPLSHTSIIDLVSLKDNGYAGLVGSGDLNVNAIGSANSVTVPMLGGGSFTNSYGWGAMYGIIINSGFFDLPPDLGLANHSLSGAMIEPAATGQLYWPMAFKENALNFIYTGLKYYSPDLGFAFSDTGWFGQKQIIESIPLNLLNNSYTDQNYLLNNITGKTNSTFFGYCLTNKPLDGATIDSGADIIDSSAARITGYIVSRNLAPGKLFGLTWKDQGNIPSVNMRFSPVQATTSIGGITNAQRVSGFFTGITDRGYPNGSGTPFNFNEPLSVFFTGLSTGNGVYLTYLSGTKGYNYMSGAINMTDFTPPRVHPLHKENYGSTGWRLATNFAPANYYGSNVYTASAGGEYPALSFDNGLELYLDISYSSPCGPTVHEGTCNEPI